MHTCFSKYAVQICTKFDDKWRRYETLRAMTKIGPMAPCSPVFLPDILRDIMPYNHLFKILTNMRNMKPKHVKKNINIVII